jgi:hypothetical protein
MLAPCYPPFAPIPLLSSRSYTLLLAPIHSSLCSASPGSLLLQPLSHYLGVRGLKALSHYLLALHALKPTSV